MSEPILFILGSAGVGKSYLGGLLEKELDFIHVEFDPPYSVEKGFVDGPLKEGLSDEWAQFERLRNPQPLADKIRDRIRSATRKRPV